MLATPWLLRSLLAAMAVIGYSESLGLWWVPALAVACSLAASLCAVWIDNTPARMLGRALANTATLCFLASIGVAVWWSA